MKILIDENIPLLTARSLRASQHELLDLRGTTREGSPDSVLWAIAKSEKRLLITTDKGFSAHRREAHHGILIIRLKQPNLQKIHDRILRAMKRYDPEEWPNMLVIMRDDAQSIWRSRED